MMNVSHELMEKVSGWVLRFDFLYGKQFIGFLVNLFPIKSDVANSFCMSYLRNKTSVSVYTRS